MRNLKILAVGCVLVWSVVMSASAMADQWNKKTVITLQEPMQIEDTLLQPGTYVLKLVESRADRHIVRIMNEDETETIATVIGAPDYRLNPTGKTDIKLHETPPGAPAAMDHWYYPGEMLGLQFTRPPVTTQVAQAAPPPAPAPQPAPAPEAPAPPPPPEQPPAPAPAPAPQPEAPPPPAPAPAPAPALPKTASNMPLLALVGLAALGISGLLRVIGRNSSL